MLPSLSEDLVVLADTVLHRAVRVAGRGPDVNSIDSMSAAPVDRLRLPTGDVLAPSARYETSGDGLDLTVACFDLPGESPEPADLRIGGREVPLVTAGISGPNGGSAAGLSQPSHHVLPPLRFEGGHVVHVLVHGDSSTSMRRIRALRFYDDTGRALTPRRQLRMLDDHTGVLAVLPTSGSVSVRLETE